MNFAWTRAVCRLLIVLMAWMPFQIAQAGMIGTDQIASQAAQADRNAVQGFLARSDVAGRLQALGVDPAGAKDRVAAMSDSEVHALADRIQSLPAAGTDGWAVALVVLVVAAVAWYVWKR